MVTSGFSRAVSRGTRGYGQRYDQSFAIARGEHSSSLWDGWIGPRLGVGRKRRRREPAGSSIRSIDVNNTYYYFIWIESSCFPLSPPFLFSGIGRNRGTHIVTIPISSQTSSSRKIETIRYLSMAFPVQIDYFSDVFRFYGLTRVL